MIRLNDYLYSGHTVLGILHGYSDDLKRNAIDNHNPIDLVHANFLIQLTELLEHNDFLTAQSGWIREFYKYMAEEYPFLSFTFKGRIKSLIRAEAKFNGNIVEYIYDYYLKTKTYPSVSELKERLNCFRDLIAYRIVIEMPKLYIGAGENRREIEKNLLYEIADILPEFLEARGFTAEPAGNAELAPSSRLKESVQPYYRDYVENMNASGYQSLHITFYDNNARCYIEVQLRTKEMDDYAEIGTANHFNYEKRQEQERARREAIPEGECPVFDEAYERVQALNTLQLKDIDVNMFSAIDNHLINDCCGLYRGRLILPYEHLSRFQNDRI